MKNEISLYEVYNILLTSSQEKNNIYSNYARELAKDLGLETIIFKKINISKKELQLLVKRYEDIGDYYSWQDLIIKQKENSFIWKSTTQKLSINIFNATNHLTQLFKKLTDIKEFLTMRPFKVNDTSRSCYIQLSQESIKIRYCNGHLVIIPLEFQKITNEVDAEELENLLKSIYLNQSDIPEWILKEYVQTNTLNVENVIKKLKIGFRKFMS